MSNELRPCPFCRSEPKKTAYDRLILIGCTPCGYERSFPGLLQKTPNDKPILQYRDGDGVREVAPENATEFYHHDANERAADAWNKRSE